MTAARNATLPCGAATEASERTVCCYRLFHLCKLTAQPHHRWHECDCGVKWANGETPDRRL